MLEADGTLRELMPLKEEEQRGKKTVQVPKIMMVPAQEKRAGSTIIPNFLCDSSSYLLGVDGKGKPERARSCFAASAALHHRLLEQAEGPVARRCAPSSPAGGRRRQRSTRIIQPYRDELMKGGNLVFRFEGRFVQEDEAVRRVWEESRPRHGAPPRQCLLPEKKGPLRASTPPSKG